MSRPYEMPQSFKDMVGTTQTFSGGLFSPSKDLPEKEYTVYGLRWGSAIVVSVQEIREKGASSYEHPTIEMLVGNKDMPRKRWTRGFPVREIDFKKMEGGSDAI